jgi:hypothetical protein
LYNFVQSLIFQWNFCFDFINQFISSRTSGNTGGELPDSYHTILKALQGQHDEHQTMTKI